MDVPQIETVARQCEKHGEYQAHRYTAKILSGCPTCREEADAAERQQREAEAEARRKAAREQRVRTLLAESGLIGRQLRCTFDTYDAREPKQKQVLADCQAYMAQFQKGQELPKNTLWLVGPAGTGKSHLGAAMVNHLINTHATPAAIHTVVELIRMLRATWGRSKSDPRESKWVEHPGGDGHTEYAPEPEGENEIIERLGNCSLLVLDDVGADHGSAAGLVQLLEIVDLRYRLERPTVVLSNLMATELKAAMGPRLYDRLREGASVKTCDWKGRRGEFPTRATA